MPSVGAATLGPLGARGDKNLLTQQARSDAAKINWK